MLDISKFLCESKKSSGKLNLIVLSASSKKDDKKSTVNIIKQHADAFSNRFNIIDIDPISADIQIKEDGAVINGKFYSVYNTVILPRRTVLKNSITRNVMNILDYCNFFIMNTLNVLDLCENKYDTYVTLDSAHIPTPKTHIINTKALSLDYVTECVNKVGGQWPVVCKILNGTQGIGVFTMDSPTSMYSTLQAMSKVAPECEILCQEKIESEFDLRIHVLCDSFDKYPTIDDYKVIGVMRRNKIPGDFRTNFSIGATVENGSSELTEKIEKIVKEVAFRIKARWVGIDVMIDKNTKEPYVLEINSSPGTAGIISIGFDPINDILNMLSNFSYTNYKPTVIGCLETSYLKDVDGRDNTNGANNALITSFSTIDRDNTLFIDKSSKVEDNVLSFNMMNGNVYKAKVAGYTTASEPIVKMDISFNSIIYRNIEFVVKKNDDRISDIMFGSTMITRTVGSAQVSQNNVYIITDKILD